MEIVIEKNVSKGWSTGQIALGMFLDMT